MLYPILIMNYGCPEVEYWMKIFIHTRPIFGFVKRKYFFYYIKNVRWIMLWPFPCDHGTHLRGHGTFERGKRGAGKQSSCDIANLLIMLLENVMLKGKYNINCLDNYVHRSTSLYYIHTYVQPPNFWNYIARALIDQ